MRFLRKEHWFPWRLWTWWHARADRRNNQPHPDATALSETERQIQSAVNTAIRDAEQRYVNAAEELKSKLAEIAKRLREIYEPEYARLQEKTGRLDVHVHLSKAVHLVLLALLTLGETAFNIVAFNIFQEPGAYTIVMASTIGVGIPVCAYFLGILIRQWPRPYRATAAKVLVVSSVTVWVLIGINRARSAYLEEQAPEFVRAHPELGAAFFAINLGVLVAAIIVTYLAHDPEPHFAQAQGKVLRTRERLRELEGRLNRLANDLRTEIEMFKEGGWQLIAYYRTINRRKRPRVPRYFDIETDKNHKPEFVSVPIEEYGKQPQPSPSLAAQKSKP